LAGCGAGEGERVFARKRKKEKKTNINPPRHPEGGSSGGTAKKIVRAREGEVGRGGKNRKENILSNKTCGAFVSGPAESMEHCHLVLVRVLYKRRKGAEEKKPAKDLFLRQSHEGKRTGPEVMKKTMYYCQHLVEPWKAATSATGKETSRKGLSRGGSRVVEKRKRNLKLVGDGLWQRTLILLVPLRPPTVSVAKNCVASREKKSFTRAREQCPLTVGGAT